MATPTEAEMRAAGVELGHLKPGQSVPPRLRNKLAKVVDAAKADAAAATARQSATENVAAPLIDMHAALTGGGIPTENVGRIVAALAPHIWRANQQGATR